MNIFFFFLDPGDRMLNPWVPKCDEDEGGGGGGGGFNKSDWVHIGSHLPFHLY